RIGGEDDLLERRALRHRRIDAPQQLVDLQPVRPDPVDRRDRAMEEVVSAPELAGPFEGQHVERLLDDAQAALVATAVAADGAQRRVADVEALLAEDDLVAYRDER